MLTIRPDQMKVFAQQLLAAFRQDAAQSLRDEYPDVCAELGPDALQQMIQKGMDDARQYRLETRGAVLIFIELILVFGDGFQLSPDRWWAHKILAHPTLPDYARMQLIRERLVSRSGGLVVRRSTSQPEEDEPVAPS
jgi:hypothetical protein